MEHFILRVVTFIVPLIVAVTFHEFSHIAMARWLGDDLGTRLGRFTLDPLKHIDPIWTVGLPVLLMAMGTMSGSGVPIIAAGKPSPYNPVALNRKFGGKRISLRYAELLVAIAGPLSNLVLAFISLFGVFVLLRMGYYDGEQYSASGLLTQFVYLNVSLFVLNLIPVHPLDGAKVLVPFLPRQAAMRFEAIGPQISWFLLLILLFGGGTFIGVPVRFIVHGMFSLLV